MDNSEISFVLCDVTGVLYNFGDADDNGEQIYGAVEAVERCANCIIFFLIFYLIFFRLQNNGILK